MTDESQANPASSGSESPATPAPTTIAQTEVISASTPPPRAWEQGFAETLAEARHELHLLSHASKFEWVNKRLILLRNAVIAFSVIVVVIIIATLCYREAWRDTLTISAFHVPEKLAERGITGEVVAQSLFDELIKRRTTVASYDAGELKGEWAEHRNDVVVPEAGFTLQSAFRYLRTLTGKEVTVNGEMQVEGEDFIITARVAGKSPREVKGKLSEWKAPLGELANYIYETTQPVVLASYWGLIAKTPEEMDALSQLIYRMSSVEPKAAPAALSVAYYAYGVALNRQNKITEALAAWEQSRTLDPEFAPPYLDAAQVLYQRDMRTSAKLYQQSATLEMSEATHVLVLSRRFTLAGNADNCQLMGEILAELEPLALSDPLSIKPNQARNLLKCEYQQAKAEAMLRNLTLLHPEVASYWNSLGTTEWTRELQPSHLQDARRAYEAGIAADKTGKSTFVRLNLSGLLAEMGEHEAALAMYKAGSDVLRQIARPGGDARIHFYRGEFKEAEALLRQQVADNANATARDFRFLGRTLEAQSRTSEALDALRAAYVRFPMYCQNYDDAAGILFKHMRDAEAFAEWEKGIAAVPKCDQTYVHFAEALIERKRVDEAKQKLQMLLKNSPESDGAAIAKDMLAGMAKPG